MSGLRRFAIRLYNFLRPNRAEAELARELEAYAALHQEQLELRGMSQDQSIRETRGEIGNVLRTKELHREARSFVWLEDARRDLQFGVRTLARTPGFTCLALLTLALGIGSVTVIYSVIHNVLLDPLPYPGSKRFVNVMITDIASGASRRGFAAAEFLDFRDQSTAFDGVIGTLSEGVLLSTGSSTELANAVHVTPNFFEVMGMPPLMGRAIGPEDARPGAPAVAVLRHRAWVGLFGADPNVVGRTVMLDGAPRTIIGVMPPRFTWHAADLWVPDPLKGAGAKFFNFQARLRNGVTPAQAEAQLTTIAARRAREHPRDYPVNLRVRVVYVIDMVVGAFPRVLYILFGAVGLLMLIACCNVANMLLARATVREREMTVRAALGAGRGRILRQLLVESLLLALVGAGLGCLLAYGGIKAVVPQLPRGPLAGEVEIVLNAPALLFSLATAILAAVLFGAAPALYSARIDLVDALKSRGRGLTGSGSRFRSGLVAAEIALALVLLLSAGLLMRSFLSLARVDLGFDPRRLILLNPIFPRGGYTGQGETRRIYGRWLERLRSLPGVEAVAAASGVPPFGAFGTMVTIPGGQRPERPSTLLQYCTDDYFRALDVRIAEGGGFSEDATQDPRRVAVVNRTFVRTYLGDVNPIGREIWLTLPHPTSPGGSSLSFEVVGVCADVRNRGVRELPAPAAYIPGIPDRLRPAVFIRTASDPAGFLNTIRKELALTDPQVAVRLATLTEILHDTTYAQPRFMFILLGVFAATGLLLAAIGVYSVMSYAVSRQTQEIAVRMALGAGRGRLCCVLLLRAGVLTVAGVAAGLAASFATTRLIADQLWNTTPHDPLVIGAATAVLVVVSIVACLIPARRAMQIEPIVALRQD
jgi:putative ABC transport system permease protein